MESIRAKEKGVTSQKIGKLGELLVLTLLRNKYNIDCIEADSAGYDIIILELSESGEQLFDKRPPLFISVKLTSSLNFQLTWEKSYSYNMMVDKLDKQHTGGNIDANGKLFYIVGFYNNADPRTTEFYIIPVDKLNLFKKNRNYNFSKNKLEKLVEGTQIKKL